MPDPVVHGLEVVDVEDDEGEIAVVAMGARDLACERLVEVAVVVEAGQRVEVRERSRLLEAARVLDRGPGAPGELLEERDLRLRRLPLG